MMQAHSPTAAFDVVVFDVLGTMVDEPGGHRTAIREAAPGLDDASLDRLVKLRQDHVESEQHRIGAGCRTYANTDVIDREAAQLVAEYAGRSDPAIIERLATAGQRLEPWHDSPAELARLAECLPVLGLSNASRAALLRLNAHAGLRWHAALSAEDAKAYKPAAEVYHLAIDAAGCPPERILMIAAHAWDLRAAKATGMRTAYVPRPVGDRPTSDDTFDFHASSLHRLINALTRA